MVTITYDALNDLVHTCADEIEKTTGFDKSTMLDLFALNDALVGYLDRYGVQYEEELEDGHVDEQSLDDSVLENARAVELRQYPIVRNQPFGTKPFIVPLKTDERIVGVDVRPSGIQVWIALDPKGV